MDMMGDLNKDCLLPPPPQGTTPQPPRAGCMTCGQAQVALKVNTNTMTLGALISQVGGVQGRVCVRGIGSECGEERGGTSTGT